MGRTRRCGVLTYSRCVPVLVAPDFLFPPVVFPILVYRTAGECPKRPRLNENLKANFIIYYIVSINGDNLLVRERNRSLCGSACITRGPRRVWGRKTFLPPTLWRWRATQGRCACEELIAEDTEGSKYDDGLCAKTLAKRFFYFSFFAHPHPMFSLFPAFMCLFPNVCNKKSFHRHKYRIA